MRSQWRVYSEVGPPWGTTMAGQGRPEAEAAGRERKAGIEAPPLLGEWPNAGVRGEAASRAGGIEQVSGSAAPLSTSTRQSSGGESGLSKPTNRHFPSGDH